ncbi:hypothetical protein PV325_005671 [Microctonus aethiopoides]|uniref:FOXO protein transactivation domain-containing protein n=1 Tax=Microctonus aethiopoides TaxID=144406 RepID=A0AA39EVJ8_9HYME|nr:hypothetical protein PV325_005671 [Microctonus aethiopoides]KAK0157604.1 hypothetical protein PV328_011324 [Microctonus aethiopoides]
MRVQNEGTGKSSWWMINPDAKPGKSARRRATSMETSKFEKRRGRVKKKVEALRNCGLQTDATPSPSSSVSEGLDLFPDSPLHSTSNFQLSPDFRPRASSNASSVGRLSPIPAIPSEPDWTPNFVSTYSPEQLAGNLAETMKLESYQMYQTPQSSNHQLQNVPPPSYFETQYQRSNSHRTASSAYVIPSSGQSKIHQGCPIHRLQSCSCRMNSNSVGDITSNYQQTDSNISSLVGATQSQQSSQQQQQQQSKHQQQQRRQQKDEQSQHRQQQQQNCIEYLIQSQQRQQRQNHPETNNPNSSELSNSCASTASTMMGQLMGALNNTTLLDDLNINIEGLQGGFDCNVDEVIKHELSMDGTLDFNFQHSIIDSSSIDVSTGDITQSNTILPNNQVDSASSNTQTVVYPTSNTTAPTAPPSWVH